MKTLSSLLAAVTALLCISFVTKLAFAQDLSQLIGPPKGVLSDFLLPGHHNFYPLYNGQGEMFDLRFENVGEYTVSTKSGSEKLKASLDALKKDGIDLSYSTDPDTVTTVTLVKIEIPKDKTIRTIELVHVLDHAGFYPAEVFEALSIEKTEQGLATRGIPIVIFGGLVSLGKNGETKNLHFEVTYPSTDGSGGVKETTLTKFIKLDSLWEKKMIIPVIKIHRPTVATP